MPEAVAKKRRMPEFDVAKAIALVAVMFTHSDIAGTGGALFRLAHDFCFTFHMPLFFIVSGYFCRQVGVTRASLARDARSLVLPYAVTAAIVVVLQAATALLQGGDVPEALRYWTVAALYGSGWSYPGMPDGIGYIGAIWFLLALFWARQLLAAILTLDHPGLWAVGLFLVGVGNADVFWLPFALQPALCATLFMYVGHVIRERGYLEKGALPVPVLCAVAFTGLYAGVFSGGLDMASNKYPGFLCVAGGVALSFLLIKACRVLCERCAPLAAPLELYGRNTLPMLCMHLVILDCAPWDGILAFCAAHGLRAWAVVLLVNFLGSLVATLLISRLPRRVSGVFFR